MGFSIGSVFAKASNDYPQLYENKTSSDHYEIIKLIDGPIDALYSINSSQQTLAQSGSSLWKINSHGEVIDYFSSSDLYSSGLIIEKEGFIDWVFTGDKQLQPFTATIDANQFSEKALFDKFDQAEIVEFSDDNEKGFAYLYQKGQMSILDISSKINDIDDFYPTQSFKKDKNLRSRETDVTASEFKNYHNKHIDVEPISREGNNWNIKSVGFKKEATHRAHNVAETLLENTLGRIFTSGRRRTYGYSVGYTQYELNHHNELMKFSVFTGDDGKEERAWNFSKLEPEKNPSGLKFIVTNYRRYNVAELNELSLLPYYEKDIGLYVVRLKIPQNKNATRSRWQVSYSGLHSYNSIWGHIHFVQDSASKSILEPAYYWFWKSRPIPDDRQYFWSGRGTDAASPILKTLPTSITFNREEFSRSNFFRVVFNGEDAWFFGNKDISIELTLEFDQTELTQAFQQLSKMPETIQLDLHMDEKPLGSKLSISLQNSKTQIPLHKVRLSSPNIHYGPTSPDPIQDPAYAKSQQALFTAYEKSLIDMNSTSFLTQIQELKSQKLITDLASPISYYFAQLSFYFNFNQKFEENSELLNYYLNHIYPNKVAGDSTQHDNITVIASQGLYLGMQSHNPDFTKLIINRFVEQNFDLEQETNRSFLFNIACYYAINHNKPKMLNMIHRAIASGKDPQEFLSDSDFKDYLQDPDFLNAVKTNRTQ